MGAACYPCAIERYDVPPERLGPWLELWAEQNAPVRWRICRTCHPTSELFFFLGCEEKRTFRSAVAATADEALIPKKEGLLPLNGSHERQAQPRFQFGLHLPLGGRHGIHLGRHTPRPRVGDRRGSTAVRGLPESIHEAVPESGESKVAGTSQGDSPSHISRLTVTGQ